MIYIIPDKNSLTSSWLIGHVLLEADINYY